LGHRQPPKTRRRVGPPRVPDFRLRPPVDVTDARNAPALKRATKSTCALEERSMGSLPPLAPFASPRCPRDPQPDAQAPMPSNDPGA